MSATVQLKGGRRLIGFRFPLLKSLFVGWFLSGKVSNKPTYTCSEGHKPNAVCKCTFEPFVYKNNTHTCFRWKLQVVLNTYTVFVDFYRIYSKQEIFLCALRNIFGESHLHIKSQNAFVNPETHPTPCRQFLSSLFQVPSWLKLRCLPNLLKSFLKNAQLKTPWCSYINWFITFTNH